MNLYALTYIREASTESLNIWTQNQEDSTEPLH